MPPADRDKPARKPRAKKPVPGMPRPASKPARKPVSKPAAATPSRPEIDVAAETNGHHDWPDYSAQTSSWDPWDDGDGAVGGVGGEGLNRTLGEWFEAVVPPEAQLHFFNAGREFAAGLQTTFEYHLRRGDDDDDGAQALRIEIE